MVLLQLEAETFHDQAKALEPPVIAFLVNEEDNPDVWLFYLEEAARIADGYRCGGCGMDGKCSMQIRSLKGTKP